MIRKRFLVAGGAIALICLIAAIVLLCFMSSLAKEHPSQLAADRWQTADLPYTQVSCFLSDDGAFASDSLYSVRKNIDTSLTTQSLSPTGDARMWYDAFSAETMLNVGINENSSVTARAFITGGDYFKIHEMEFISGWYYTDDSLADDGVILDSNLAWKLFGGYDLDSMTVYVSGVPCRVVGVTRSPLGEADEEAYGTNPSIFISYKFAERMGFCREYTVYEAVVPNPVDGIGIKTVKDNISFGKDCVIVENDGRFGFVCSLGTLMNFETLVQRTDRVYFPYYENSARGLEAKCAFIALIIVVLFAVSAVYVITAMVIAYMLRGIYIEKLKYRVANKKIRSKRR